MEHASHRHTLPVRSSGVGRSMMTHRVLPALATMLLLLVAIGCTSRTDIVPAVRIATGPDPESILLASTALELLASADIEAELVPFGDERSARQAIELGDVDVHLAYSGEVWLDLGRANPPGDVSVSLESVGAADLERGIVWLLPGQFAEVDGVEQIPANATFAFFVAGPPAVDADLRTLSQLALRLSERPDASICVDSEFGRRPDGLAAMLSAYSVRRDRPFLAADPTQAVLGVLAGDCLAGLSHATDGRAWRAGLLPLVDDLRFFPAFVPAPTVRSELLAGRPAVADALGPLAGQLSTGLLGRANARVEAGRPISTVASELAAELRLRASERREG
jgi:glycine betaine/choline ABC-type transport system substrate-binding protein